MKLFYFREITWRLQVDKIVYSADSAIISSDFFFFLKETDFCILRL